MSALTLIRSPRALFLDRVVPSLFCTLLAFSFVMFARWYAKTISDPELAVIALFVVFSLALFCVAWAFARRAPWQKELRVSKDGAVTVLTTRGEMTVPAGKAIAVTVVRYGIALKYRGKDGQDLWLGISNGYEDEANNRLSGYALIDRINESIGAEAIGIGRRHQALNRKMLRVLLVILGFLFFVVVAIAAVRVVSGG